jgi:uncharacterized membrane protein YgcG
VKKIIVVMLSVIFAAIVLTVPVSAAGGKVFLDDSADLLTESQEDGILTKMKLTADETGWNIIIATKEGEYTYPEAEEMLVSLYNGKFGNAPGAAYIMTTEIDKPEGQNDYMLAVHMFGGVTLQHSKNYVLDQVERPFLNYNEYGSANAFLNECEPYKSSFESFRLQPGRLIFPGIFFAAIPAAICIAVVSVRYRSHPKVSASRYLNMNESRFWRRADTFVREFTTRVPVSNGSGGGGGGRGGGGFSGGGGRGGRR